MSKKASVNPSKGKKVASKNAFTQMQASKFVNSIVQQLDALSKTRENWEATDYKKANEGLYQLLSECLAVFNTQYVKADKDSQKVLRSELTNRLTEAGVKVLATSSTLTMFVRFVFNSDRNRAHGYAKVLLAAISEGIDAKDLPDFIIEAGGIEEIKRRQVKSQAAIDKKAKIDAAKAEVESEVELAAAMTPLTTVDLDGLTGSYALLLVKPSLDGTASVVGTLSDLPDTLVQSLFVRMAKVRVQESMNADAVAKADEDILAASLSASNDPQMKKAA
jgi:hypothetical protein